MQNEVAHTFKILILEDDLEAVSKILSELRKLEKTLAPNDFAVTIFSTWEDVAKLVNLASADAYDVILLDRDCKLCGSFHILNIEKFGAEKIISISSMPQWNEAARKRGVTRIVLKTYDDLENFAEKISKEVREVMAI